MRGTVILNKVILKSKQKNASEGLSKNNSFKLKYFFLKEVRGDF